MKIAVVGTGYVGLVAGACFAAAGTDVTCVDVDEAKLSALKQGDVPFYEPGLSTLVKRNASRRLHFTSDLASAVDGSDLVFVAVGTPPNEDGSADLSHVLAVARDVARAATHPVVLVLKSTVPVGTNKKVCEVVEREGKHPVSVVSNPEFLKEGAAVSDFQKPDRIVVGTDDDDAFELMFRLYAPFNRQRNRIIRTSPASAEIVKYAANAMLGVKISFMNEIATLCEKAGGDVEDVRVAIGSDSRIGFQFLYPGLGFGGSCFPKDLRALVRTGAELGAPCTVVEAATSANRRPVEQLFERMKTTLGDLQGKVIAVWGLSFKPRTDDVREAPALRLIEMLVHEGASIRASDPEGLETAGLRVAEMKRASSVSLLQDEYAAAEGADALVVATEWEQYRSPDAERLQEVMRGRQVFDGRNCVLQHDLVERGFLIHSVGRPTVGAPS